MRIESGHISQLPMVEDRRVAYVGHGRLESAPETLSPLHVISHELGHVTEFKNEAIQQGRDIDSIRVKINYEFRNGRMIAVSGETEAHTRLKPKEESLEPYSDGKKFDDLFSIQKAEAEDEKKSKSLDPSAKEKQEKIQKKDLEDRIRDLETRLQSEKAKPSMGLDSISGSLEDNPFAPKGIQGQGKETERTKELQREKARLEEEVRALKIKEQLKETFSMLTDIRKAMITNVFGMISFNEDSKPGGLLDTFV